MQLRKTLRLLGFGFLMRSIRHRYGWKGKGLLKGYRVLNPEINEYASGVCEPAVVRVLVQLVKPGWLCVDVGAHKGFYTLLLARLAGKRGTVISFEAHPENAEAVRRNVVVNHLDSRVRIENVAVTSGPAREIPLFFGRHNSSTEWNILGHDVAGNVTEIALMVPAISLDEYFSPNVHLDLVKMDIEGAEGQALSGMRRILKYWRPAIVVEFHDDAAWCSREILFDAQYVLFDIEQGKWVTRDHIPRIYHCLAVHRDRVNSQPK